MKFQSGKKYKTKDGQIAEVVRIADKENFFPIKVKLDSGVYYTVTQDGNRLWNVKDDPLDLTDEEV